MKKAISILTVICMMLALAGCNSKTVLSNGETVTAKRVYQLGHVNTSAEDDQYQYFAMVFANKIKELSKGEIAIDIVTDSVPVSYTHLIILLSVKDIK